MRVAAPVNLSEKKYLKITKRVRDEKKPVRLVERLRIVLLAKVSNDPLFEENLHILVDNCATHKHEKVNNRLKRHKRVELHFISTGSPWLNLVERFFGVITEKAIRRRVFSSVAESEEKIMQYIDRHNASPEPFVWTKTSEDILEKIKRARNKLNNPQLI